jgi:hypothetical protein
MSITFEIDMPKSFANRRWRLPAGVQSRLQNLLDKQDGGEKLSRAERVEAEGLVELAELLSLIRLRSKRGQK